MKTAQIVAVPSQEANGYAWKWRCEEAKAESTEIFGMYYDCFTDARKHGYSVELTHAQGLSAPGGARQRLA